MLPLRGGLILLVFALALGLAGPFGTAISMPAAPRIAYWLATVAAIGGIMSIVLRLLARHAFPGGLPWWAVAATGLAIAIPGTLVVEHCLGIFAPELLTKVDRAEIFLQVLGMNLVLAPLCRLLRQSPIRQGLVEQNPSARPAAPPAAGNPLADRLPDGLRAAPLLALSAEDHYLRVYTDAGNALILMRLADAVAALAGCDGLQVHRSHWVARGAIDRVERRNGQITLHLRNAATIPVSRSRAGALQSAGWLAR